MKGFFCFYPCIFSRQYESVCCSLRSYDAAGLEEERRKAFFINVYNCLTMHVFVAQAELPEVGREKIHRTFYIV